VPNYFVGKASKKMQRSIVSIRKRRCQNRWLEIRKSFKWSFTTWRFYLRFSVADHHEARPMMVAVNHFLTVGSDQVAAELLWKNILSVFSL
jgi:hypothetical protein